MLRRSCGLGPPETTKLWIASHRHCSLSRTARAYIRRERAAHTLESGALVNEAFLRLVDINSIEWRDRARHILVDHTRSHRYRKRGGGVRPVFFEESAIVSADRDADLIAFNDALNALEKRDARKVRVVEMRFFGGLSVKEIAEALKVSTQTVWRGWSLSKAWLAREMSERPNG